MTTPAIAIPTLRAVRMKVRSDAQILNALVSRDFQTRYAGSLLGVSWTQFYPLLILGVYWFVFSSILPSQVDRFPLFLFVGIVLWSFFSSSIQLSTNALLASAYLVKNLRFPLYLVVISAIATAGIDLLASHVIVFAGAAFFGVPFRTAWFVLPPIVLLLALTALGLGLALSAVAVFLRDIKFFVDVTMSLLIFVTPVFYSDRVLSPSLHWLLLVNPLASAITAYRQAFLDGQWPNASLVFPLVIAATLCLTLGYIVFAAAQKRIVDAL